MKLDENDVKAVARNRYWTKKRTALFLLAMLITFGVVLVISYFVQSLWSLCVLIPLFVYFWLVVKGSNKFQKELVQQWKDEKP